MKYMNEYDVESALNRYADHPILGPATLTLANLTSWTNHNSDGWPYWSKPARAAERLMELIEPSNGGSQWRFDDERVDVSEAEYAAALRPIKAFRTRHGADFTIVTADHSVKA